MDEGEIAKFELIRLRQGCVIIYFYIPSHINDTLHIQKSEKLKRKWENLYVNMLKVSLFFIAYIISDVEKNKGN